MTSPQRRQALEVFQDWGPLPPRAIAAQLGISQDAARQLIRRMVKDGQLRSAEGDGRYRVREGGAESVHITRPDDAGERQAESHDVTEESNAVTEGEAVTEQGSPGYPSRIGTGVFVYDHKTGGSRPWKNKALEGGYD